MSLLRLNDELLDIYRSMTTNKHKRKHSTEDQIADIEIELLNRWTLDYRRESGLTLSMSIYGIWHGMTGVIKIADGDISGWNDFATSFLYRAWEVRTFVASGDRAGKINGMPLREGVSECLMLSMILKEYAFAKWCGSRILRSFKTGEGSFVNDKEEGYFDPFVLQLYAAWQQDPIDISKFDSCDLGPYTDLAKNLTGRSEDFASAMDKACEYHCSYDGMQNYVNAPLVHIPAELLMAIQIRRESGLSIPKLSHPILETPFCKLPDEFPRPVDPLLDRAVAKIREAHPEIGDPW